MTTQVPATVAAPAQTAAPAAAPATAPMTNAEIKAARTATNRQWAASVASEIRDVPTSVEQVAAETANDNAAPEAPADSPDSTGNDGPGVVKTEEPPPEASKPREEPPPPEIDNPDGPQGLSPADRVELERAWTRIHKEVRTIKQQREEIRKAKADLEEYKSLKADLSDPSKRYAILEKHGGSLGEWQSRAVAGEEPNPQVQDAKKFFEEQVAMLREEVQKINQQRDQERVQYAIQNAEQTFAQELVDNAQKSPHFRAHGPEAVDRAYDFAENVARRMKGRTDIPRAEIPYIDEYLRATPKMNALDPSSITRYFAYRLSKEASRYTSQGQPEPQGHPARPAAKADSAQATKPAKPALDNATAAQRGAAAPRKDPSKMSAKEFARAYADEVRTLDED